MKKIDSWKRKFLAWREKNRLSPLDRKDFRTTRQLQIQAKKIQMAKDLSTGHNLEEFDLHPEDFRKVMMILRGKMISWFELEKMFRKYR